MRVVLNLTNYASLTGSTLYNFELAKQLHSRGSLVMILANEIGGQVAAKTPKGIPIHPFFNHPTFPADLVISSQPAPTSYGLKAFPDAFHMQVIHSTLPYEEPVIDKRVKLWIAVRPEIKEHWANKWSSDRWVKVIWNGVDTTRFNTNNKEMKHKNRVFTRLFVGTADYLRQKVITDLMQTAVSEKSNLWLVLDRNPFGKERLPDNITIYQPTFKIETYTKNCDETAGIFIGRTTIEGFMCGKPGLVYNVDEQGNITDKMTYGVPKNKHIFDIKFMVDRLSELYMQYK